MTAALALAGFLTALSPGAATAAPGTGAYASGYRSGCVRSLQEFAYELSSAIEAGDPNRLAALYRWNGTTTRAGYETMARLQAIAARPLLQVVPVHAAPEPAAEPVLAEPLADQPSFAEPLRGPPVALRLDQTLADGVTPATTVLRLRRELGCWWVTL